MCHRFAGKILVPDELITTTLRDETLRPRHVEQLRNSSHASWEAVAVRLAERQTEPVAVVLVREQRTDQALRRVDPPRMGVVVSRSSVDPEITLARAHRVAQTAIPDTYRHQLAYPRRMFCDTLPIHDNLAIAVLSDRPSDRHFEILEEPEPAWKTKEEVLRVVRRRTRHRLVRPLPRPSLQGLQPMRVHQARQEPAMHALRAPEPVPPRRRRLPGLRSRPLTPARSQVVEGVSF